jgi:hypothetical protein
MRASLQALDKLPHRTTSRSSPRLDVVNGVHRHRVGGREVPTDRSSKTVALAFACLEQREGPSRALLVSPVAVA